MPDPTRARRSPSSAKDPRPAQPPEPLTDDASRGPLWARAVHLFHDPGLDVRTRAAFQEALNDYAGLTPHERAFQDTHLLYRVAMGLEGIFGVLRRIEARLDETTSPDLRELEHLEPIRAALEEIASAQAGMMEAASWGGEEEEEVELIEEEPDEQDPDEQDPDVIYDTLPEEPPEPPRPRRRALAAEAPKAEPPRIEPPTARADPDREVLVGDLVPAREEPHHEAGAR